jgi:hypothetical protein
MAINNQYLPLILKHESKIVLDNFEHKIINGNATKYYCGADKCPWILHRRDAFTITIEPTDSESGYCEEIKIWIAYMALIMEKIVECGITIVGTGLYTFLEYQEVISSAGVISISEKIFRINTTNEDGRSYSYIFLYKNCHEFERKSSDVFIHNVDNM